MRQLWRPSITVTRTFLRCGLALDPALADASSRELSFDAQRMLDDLAGSFARRFWTKETIANTFGDAPLPKSLGRTAVVEVLISTAAVRAHETDGQPVVTPIHVKQAVSRFEAFVERAASASD